MSNEIATTETVSVARYNRNLGDTVIQISIKVKDCKTKDGKKKFKSVKGLKYLPVINDEGVNEGKKNRWIDVHFMMDAFDDVPEGCEVHKIDDLSTGFLYVKAKGIQSPKSYKVTEDEEGNKVYPTIWIKGGIVGFEPYVSGQDEFEYHSADGSFVDAETGEVETGELHDEPSETEETKIK